MKVIISDMDGSLLRTDKTISSSFQNILNQLKEKDIKMVLASGRSLYSIKERVEEFDYNFDFIAENGALIEIDNKLVYQSLLNQQDLLKIVETARLGDDVSIVLASKEQAYVELASGHKDAVEERFIGFKAVTDALDLNEEILRVSLYSPKAKYNYEKIYKSRLSDIFHLTLTGNEWINITNKNIHKGRAVKKYQELTDIDLQEMIAFGDYDNDIEMLKTVGVGYALANASDALKQEADEIIASNDEDAVINKIGELLNEKTSCN